MTIHEMRQVILNDNETKHLKLSDDDVLTVYQYLIERDRNEDKLYIPVLITEPYIEVILKPSAELRAKLKEREMRKHLISFDSEIYIQDAKLSDFKVFNEEREKAFQAAQEFLENYTLNKYYPGLYLQGAYSTGKTYLLSAIAHELAKKHIKVLFIAVPDLVRSLKDGFQEGDLEERVNMLKQVDVLMLDDLGGEHVTQWFRDEILLPVLQYRLSAKLPIFVSSNLSIKKLFEALSVTKNETDQVKAMRIIQRIKDMTKVVEMSEKKYDSTEL